MIRHDWFGAFDVPDLPTYPPPPGTDWVIVLLLAAVLVLGFSLVAWYLRDHAPGKGALSGLVLMTSLMAVVFAIPYYGMWSDGRAQRAREPVDKIYEEYSELGVPQLAEWYGIYPVDVSIDYESGWDPVIIEVDGWVQMDCYTVIRDGRVGIACGADPMADDNSLDDLVELPRASERSATQEGPAA